MDEPTSGPKGSVQSRRLDYICMQPTRQGQASYAHVNEIVAGLRRRGWDVRLIEPSHPRPGRADGVRRVLAAASTQFTYWIKCGFRPARFVYIRSHFLNLPTAILARMSGSIVIQEVNGPSSDTYDAWPQLRPLHGVLSLISRSQIRMADAVVVVTPGLEGYVRERSGRRDGYHVIGNGANVVMFQPADLAPREIRRPRRSVATPATADPARYVVFVGALASWQGVDTMLEALRSPAWPPDVDLVIAGDGVERAKVQAAAQSDRRIRWLGTVPYRDSPGLISKSLAALIPKADGPSARFGLSPLKFYEAMACGVPRVVSDLPGLGDIVRAHECGITVPAGDPEALATAVAELAADSGRASEMGSNGRAAAVKLFSWDARAGQTERVLLEMLAKRQARGADPAS
jgi:glycosyltransferase involved in cell wall biosynthesis